MSGSIEFTLDGRSVQAREGVGVERQPRPADEEHRCGERCSGGDADPPVHGRDSRTLTGPEVLGRRSLSPGRVQPQSSAGAASVLGGERGGDRIEG